MMYSLLTFVLFPLDSIGAIYTALFVFLVISGLGLPLPEEVTLLFGGYLAYLGVTNFWPTIYVLIIGIIAADSVGYGIGRFGGDWFYTRIACKSKYLVALVSKTQRYFDRHGEKMVLLTRPLFGVRVAVPILAGHFRMNFIKFLIYDALAAIPWTIFLVSLSYYLGSGLDLITEVREIKHIMFAVIAIGISSYSLIRFIVKKKRTIRSKSVYQKSLS